MEEECLKNSKNLQYIRCLKCNKIIKCQRHDTSKLIEHIRSDHPEVKVIDSDTTDDMKKKADGLHAGDSSDGGKKATHTATTKQDGPLGSKEQKSSSTQHTTKRTLFRTSIEHWRPANGTIYCPFCCCKKQPIIKMRNERMSSNTFAANCILACWPLCFLPFLIPGNEKEYLYCANCKCFLGLYDRSNNCVRPNRQFTERQRNSQCTMAPKEN